jgi:hypothetical protein
MVLSGVPCATEHPMASTSSAKVAAFVAETQRSLGASDRELLIY